MPTVSSLWLLTAIAVNLISRPNTFDLAIKFLSKGELLIEERKSFSELHSLYLQFSKAYKAKRDLNSALQYSKKMIDISEEVSNEFIKQYGKNDVSHQGFIDYLDHLEEKGDQDMFQKIEDKARKEMWRGPW